MSLNDSRAYDRWKKRNGGRIKSRILRSKFANMTKAQKKAAKIRAQAKANQRTHEVQAKLWTGSAEPKV